MALQTASQVSQNYGVSTRMLRYYEQMGLIESNRKDDYAYRVYDENALRRLQQIIILRKLQIPVKKISVILKNPDAATATEIFKANISELQAEINSLSTIKSVLEIFVAKIEELATVRLDLNLLTDESVIKLAESLSLIQKNVKEIKTMDELDQASEQLSKLNDDDIRIIYLPPMTVAASHYIGEGSESGAMNPIYEFVQKSGLYKIKPDARYFGFNNSPDPAKDQINKSAHGYEFWVTIPDDMEVPAPLAKKKFSGGLYACHTSKPINFDEWRFLNEWSDNSDDFEHDVREPRGMGGRLEEHFSQYVYGLENPKKAGLSHIDFLLPVREIKILTGEQKEKLDKTLAELEKTISQNEAIKVNLTTMMNKNKNADVGYENGLLILHNKEKYGGECIYTQKNFTGPVKIKLRAMTDDNNIVLTYHKGFVIVNWDDGKRDTLFVRDLTEEKYFSYKKRGRIPTDTFVDIEWTIGRDRMILKIDGELRMTDDSLPYIAALTESGLPPAPVGIQTSRGTTITVESLFVTEIDERKIQ